MGRGTVGGVIEEEEKRGYKRNTEAELIEERSATKQKERERLNNLKRMEEDEEKAEDKEEGKKEVDEEVKLPETETSLEAAKEDHKKKEEKRVTDLYYSFTPQATTGTCEQEDRERKSSSSLELDVSTEEGEDQKSSSPKVLDKTSEVDIDQQVKEAEFKDVKEKLVKEEVPKEETWVN